MDPCKTQQISQTKIQCDICKGSGFVKYETILCKYCDGIKCMYCNSTGYYKMPWDLCETCCGDGEQTIKIITCSYTNML